MVKFGEIMVWAIIPFLSLESHIYGQVSGTNGWQRNLSMFMYLSNYEKSDPPPSPTLCRI